MKLIILSVLIIPMVAIFGCSGAIEAVVERAIDDTPQSAIDDTTPRGWAEKAIIQRGVENLLIYPPKVLIGNIGRNGHVDSVCLKIDNSFTENLTVFVTITTPERITNDADTGIEYQPAPAGFESYIAMPRGEICVLANSIYYLPVEITLPDNVSAFPHWWEFNIKVAQGEGIVTTALIQRWLITMR